MSSASLIEARVPAVVEPRPRRDYWGLGAALILATVFGLAGLMEVSYDGPAMTTLGVVITALAVRAALVKPRAMPLFLAVYVPYNYMYPLLFLDISGANLTNILLLVALVAWVSSRVKRPQRTPVSVLDGFVLLYAAVAALAVFRAAETSSPSVMESIMDFKEWVHPILFYFVVRGLVQDRRDIRNLMAVILLGTVMVAIGNWAEGRDLAGSSIDKARAGGLLAQPNSMGAFLVYYGAPLLALFLRPLKGARVVGLRWLCLGGFLIAARSLLYTYSRGAYGAMVAAVASILLLANPLLLAILVAIGSGAHGMGLLPESVQDRLGLNAEDQNVEIYDPSMTDNLDKSTQQRIVLWGAAQRMIEQNPWRGVGLERFAYEVDAYVDHPLDERHPRDAHNAYLLAGAEMGIPGLVAMVLVILAFGLRAFWLYFTRRNSLDRALALGLCGTIAGIIASCMFGSRFQDDGVIGFFWMLAAGMVIMGKLPEKAVKRTPAPAAGGLQ
jgi:O-antigen ligase